MIRGNFLIRRRALLILANSFFKAGSLLSLLALLTVPVGYAGQERHGATDLASIRRMLEQGDRENATRDSREVIADPATDPETLLKLGQLLAERQIFPVAQAAFSRVLEIEPKSFPAAFNLG